MTQAVVSNSNSHSNSSLSIQTDASQSVTSFDSGYEHSLAHYVDVKLLVLEANEEKYSTPATYAAAS